MSLLFMDSWDNYAVADITEKWTQIYISGGDNTPTIGAFGRHSSNGLRFANPSNGAGTRTVAKTFVTSGNTFVFGFSFNEIVGTFIDLALSTNLDPNSNRFAGSGCFLAQIRQGGQQQVTLRLENTGALAAFRGGTLLGTSALSLSLAQNYFIEFRGTIHNSTGTIEVRVNGVVWLSLTGQNTQNTGSATWDEFALGHLMSNAVNPITWDFDDLYLLDGSGAAPWNTFLGDVRCDVRSPTGAGATTGWVPSAGANWQNVDDIPPNDDTDYNSAAASGVTDTFVVQDAPIVGAAILGIQHNISVKKLDAGTATIAPVIRSGSDFVGADFAVPSTYAFLTQCAQVNPATAAQWTEAGFNAAEFGYRRTA